MSHQNNAKVKEVISTLCKVLSALDIDSVPTAEVFRRAKFNKTDAVQDLWSLLLSLLSKTYEVDCACVDPTASNHPDSQFRFVRSVLWHCGYGGWWVVQGSACKDDIGSRDLLLAISWLLSLDLLQILLQNKVIQLEELVSPARMLCGGLLKELKKCREDKGSVQEDLRSLQWQYGKIKLHFRSLLAAQQEQAKLCNKVFSSMCSPSSSDTNTADLPNEVGSSALDEELERIQSLNRILDVYLQWKLLEPMFWCWMDSVIDCFLADENRKESVDRPPKVHTATCCHSDHVSKSVTRLDNMLLRMQTEVQRKAETTHGMCTDTSTLSQSEKEEIESKVAARLHALSLVNKRVRQKGLTTHFEELQTLDSTQKDHRSDPGMVAASGTFDVVTELKELEQMKVALEWKLELMKEKQRKEIEAWAKTSKGLVLTLPLKR